MVLQLTYGRIRTERKRVLGIRIETDQYLLIDRRAGLPICLILQRWGPVGAPKEVTLGYILKYADALKRGLNADTCPPLADRAKRIF